MKSSFKKGEVNRTDGQKTHGSEEFQHGWPGQRDRYTRSSRNLSECSVVITFILYL